MSVISIINVGGAEKSAVETVSDVEFLKDSFVETVQKRGAATIAARKRTLAMLAAKAAYDHMHDC